MGGLMRPEFLLLLIAALLLFGAKRLPEMGSSIGKTIKEFQRSMKEVTHPADAAPALLPPAPSAGMQPTAGLASSPTTEDVDAVAEAAPVGAVRQRE